MPERTRRSSHRAIAPRPAEPGSNPLRVRRAAPWPATAGTPCPGPSDLPVGGISKRSHRVRFAGHGAVCLADPDQNDIWIERFHQTLKRWLARQPAARTLGELQAQLDALRLAYNEHRPHRATGRITPAEAYRATPKAMAAGSRAGGPLPAPLRRGRWEGRHQPALGRAPAPRQHWRGSCPSAGPGHRRRARGHGRRSRHRRDPRDPSHRA